MGRPKKEDLENVGTSVENLNSGVNYMNQNQAVAPNVQPVQNVAPVQNNAPVNNSQPIVNTAAANAKVNELTGKAKGVANNFVGKLKSDKRVLIATVVVVVVLLVLLSTGFRILSPSYWTANAYMSAYKKMDAEKIVSLQHKDLYEDEDDEIDELEDRFDALEDDDYKITSYKFRECEKYSEDELEDLAERLEEYYDIDEKDVQAARTYYIRVKSKTDDEKDIGYRAVTVVKIEGKWYLYN